MAKLWRRPVADGELDAAGVGGVECGEVARADAAIIAEQRAVQVDCDEADGVVVCCCRQVASEYEYRGWGMQGNRMKIPPLPPE